MLEKLRVHRGSHDHDTHQRNALFCFVMLLLTSFTSTNGFSTSTFSRNYLQAAVASSSWSRPARLATWLNEQSPGPASPTSSLQNSASGSDSINSEGDGGAITNEKISLIYRCLSLLRVVVDNIRPRLTRGKKGRHLKLVESAAFKSLSDWAFSVCDSQGDGKIQREELYSGILLVHLHLAKYVGVAACQPLNRTQVDDLFEMAASYNNVKTIGQREFEDIVVYSCAQITSRIGVYYTMLLVLAPFLTQRILRTARYFKSTLYVEHISLGVLDPLWLFGEWLVEHTVSVSVFVLAIPWAFSIIDPNMRRLIKPKRRPKNIFWWQKLESVQKRLFNATNVDAIKEVFQNAAKQVNATVEEEKEDNKDSKNNTTFFDIQGLNVDVREFLRNVTSKDTNATVNAQDDNVPTNSSSAMTEEDDVATFKSETGGMEENVDSIMKDSNVATGKN